MTPAAEAPRLDPILFEVVRYGPVIGGWEVNLRLTDLIFQALAVALPERRPACTKGMVCHAGVSLEGPAIIEEFDSTVSFHPGCRAGVDQCGNRLITAT